MMQRSVSWYYSITTPLPHWGCFASWSLLCFWPPPNWTALRWAHTTLTVCLHYTLYKLFVRWWCWWRRRQGIWKNKAEFEILIRLRFTVAGMQQNRNRFAKPIVMPHNLGVNWNRVKGSILNYVEKMACFHKSKHFYLIYLKNSVPFLREKNLFLTST